MAKPGFLKISISTTRGFREERQESSLAQLISPRGAEHWPRGIDLVVAFDQTDG